MRKTEKRKSVLQTSGTNTMVKNDFVAKADKENLIQNSINLHSFSPKSVCDEQKLTTKGSKGFGKAVIFNFFEKKKMFWLTENFLPRFLPKADLKKAETPRHDRSRQIKTRKMPD